MRVKAAHDGGWNVWEIDRENRWPSQEKGRNTVSDTQETSGPSDALLEAFSRRPRMTYENLSLVFSDEGDLIIEQLEAGAVAGQVTIPSGQINVVLAFIKEHRLSPMQAGISAAFAARTNRGNE